MANRPALTNDWTILLTSNIINVVIHGYIDAGAGVVVGPKHARSVSAEVFRTLWSRNSHESALERLQPID